MADRGPVRLRAADLARAAGGQLVAGAPDLEAADVAIDSRQVRAGDLFVAIRGDRFDGHAFVADAVRGGAGIVMVSDRAAARPLAEAGAEVPGGGGRGPGAAAVIVVADTVRALQAIARDVRRRSGARVVAITGSVGKTTTKELAAAFLATRHDVVRTPGNRNNHIGLPLSLIALRRRPDVAVVEMGMNHAGEIRALVGVAEPDVRVWTNVAEVHAASFASVDAIADAKAEILDGAGPGDQLVANAGDPRVLARIGRFPGRVTTFAVEAGDAGSGPAPAVDAALDPAAGRPDPGAAAPAATAAAAGARADVRAEAIEDRGIDGVQLSVRTPAGAGVFRTRLVGAGQAANVLAAVAVALRFQVPLDAMVQAAAAFAPLPRRGAVARLRRGVTLVDDSYNSSPAALAQALRSLGRDRAHRRRVAVLGEMLELGPDAPARHRAAGRLAVEAGFDLVVAVGGPAADALAQGARDAGLAAGAVVACGSSLEAAAVAAARVQPDDLVLVKGSRGVGTDAVADRIAGEWGG